MRMRIRLTIDSASRGERVTRLPGAESGLALLALLLLLFLAGTAIYLGSVSATSIQLQRQQITLQALAQAKEALIAYAVTYRDTHLVSGLPAYVPGYLPCPDLGLPTNQEGNEAPTCGAKDVSIVGRLPWKALGLPDLRDGNGECLWYAVSGYYKANTKTDMLNWDTLGQFEVKTDDGSSFIAGSSPDSRAVAVVFSPGVAKAQSRNSVSGTDRCGGNYVAGNYLDSDPASGINNATLSPTAGAISQFIFSGTRNQVNDKLVFITAQEIFSAIQRRTDFRTNIATMTQATAECIAEYGKHNSGGLTDKRLPWAVPLAIANYGMNSNYNDGNNLLSGRVPYLVNTSRTATGNSILAPYYQLTNLYCPAGWDNVDEWWNNWKDNLFYALAADYRPTATTPSFCGPACLKVNGTGQYAAVVLFSGKKLTGQARNSNADKAVISNYLESNNASNHPNIGGNSNYLQQPYNSAFNDIVYCINGNLTVALCP